MTVFDRMQLNLFLMKKLKEIKFAECFLIFSSVFCLPDSSLKT